MKKLLLLVTVLFISISSFAQSKTIDQNITKLMYAKNGMGAIENVTTKLATGISENKRTEFSTKLNSLKTEFIQKTMVRFKKDYTNEEITAIYNEFHSDKINYTDETNNFFAKFRKLKGEFSKSAKELYFQYK